jgi:hypothetical protein
MGEWSASRPGRALPRGKDPRYPLYRRLGGPQSRSGHRDYRKKPLPPAGIEPRSPGRPARSQTLYCLSYPGSLTSQVPPLKQANPLLRSSVHHPVYASKIHKISYQNKISVIYPLYLQTNCAILDQCNSLGEWQESTYVGVDGFLPCPHQFITLLLPFHSKLCSLSYW